MSSAMPPIIPTPLPLDLRLMRLFTLLCWAGLIALGVAAAGLLLVRLPIFNVKSITLNGDFSKVNQLSVAHAALNAVTGTALNTNLQTLQSAIGSQAYVRSVQVHRRFPNQLWVDISEHVPVAMWGKSDDENIKMLNSYGEIFEGNANDVDTDNMVQLLGPDTDAPKVLAMYRQLTPTFQSAQQAISILQLSSRGTWSTRTAQGASIELGEGDAAQLQSRLGHFFQTLPKITERLGTLVAHLESADLRHPDGYALRLRGVSTEGKASASVKPPPQAH